MAKSIIYKEHAYPTLRDLHNAKAFPGIPYQAFVGRMALGWDVERALSEPMGKNINRKYFANGIIFNSLKDLSVAAKISYEAAVKRMHRGWSDEEIFAGRGRVKKEAPALVKKSRGKAVIVGGCEYENLRLAYDSVKPSVSFNTVRARVRNGWEVEEALEVKIKIDGRSCRLDRKEIWINGESLTVQRAAEKFGVSISTVHDRLNRGATPRQALGLDIIEPGSLITQSEAYTHRAKSKRVPLVVRGVTYRTIAELARAYKLDSALVGNRIRDNGWTPEKAVTEPVAKPVVVLGQTYRSAMNAWESIGLTNSSTYAARRLRGFSIEVCLGIEDLPAADRYEVCGETFSSLSDVAAKFDLTVGQINSRLKTMSLEEAVKYVPSNGRYSEEVFKQQPDLACTKGELYFVKIRFSEGILHKVGITRKTVAHRFSGQDYSILFRCSGELLSLYRLEQRIILENRHLHYRADDEFEGRTETFLLTDSEESHLCRAMASTANEAGLRLLEGL